MQSEMSRNIYCEEYLNVCGEFAGYAKTFGEIVDKDSPGKNFGFSADISKMKSIDMDEVEKDISGRNDKTMDCVIGVGQYRRADRRFVDKRLMLVELKLNCDRDKRKPNLRKSDYVGKIKHTRELLSTYVLHPSYVFLFTEECIGDAKHKVKNYSRGRDAKLLNDIVLLTPEQFNGFVGFKDQADLEPIYSKENILSEFKKASTDPDSFEKVFRKWEGIAFDLYKKYNLEDALYISRVIIDFANEYRKGLTDEADREYVGLLAAGEAGRLAGFGSHDLIS